MLEEAKGDFLVHCVVLSQNKRNFQHAKAVERHPCGAVGLIQVATRWEGRTAVENPDIVEAKEAPGKYVAPFRILAVDPPAEIQHQALEGALQKAQVRSAQFRLNSVEKHGGPRVN